MNKTIANALYIGLIVGLFIFMFLTVRFLYSEGRECGRNPFVFGASKMGNVECSCSQYKNPSCPAQFSFNDSSFIVKSVRCNIGSEQGQFPKIDLGSLNLTITP